MLHELLPVHRSLISMDLLPERIKWQQEENIMGLEQGRHFQARERGTGRPVVGKCMGTQLIYTYVDSMPSFSEQIVSKHPEWKCSAPVWEEATVQVDMQTTVDLGYMDKRYIEACVGAPLALFVKSTLLRSRVTTGFHNKLRELLVTPEKLAEYHKAQEFPLPGHTEAFHARIEDKHGDILTRDLAELKQTETQLQIVLLLELLAHDPTVEKQIDLHFDRLLLWQALSDQRQDSVVDFCSQVIWPFYRVTNNKKAEELFLRAKGKRDRITKEDKLLKKQVIKEEKELFKKSVSLLERARTMRQATMPLLLPSSEPAKKPSLVTVKPSSSTLQIARREVEVSFKRQKLPKRARPMATTEPTIHKFSQRAERSETVHVYATPVAKRKVLLAKEPIDLPDMEIGSTDEDEPETQPHETKSQSLA